MTLLTTQKAAELLNTTSRTIERRAARGLYKYVFVEGLGRGGRQLRVVLESLPQAAQDLYHGIEKERQ